MSGALLDGASLGDVISSGWLIVIVVGCSSVIDVEMVGARNSGALVGTVALLLTAVAGDVIEKSSVSSRSCLHKSHPFSCCWVVGGSVVPVASGVVVQWDWCPVAVEHGDGAVQVFGVSVGSHGTIIV